MKWVKKGRIFEQDGDGEYLHSHAANPLVLFLSDSVIRVLFSSRNKANKSSVGYFDYDLKEESTLSNGNSKCLFKYGPAGSFYDHGLSLGCTYTVRNRNYILFMGWQFPENEHWRGDIGRLELTGDWKLKLSPSTAFIASDDMNSISLSYPWVIHEEGVYRMWFGSTRSWTSENNEMIHVIDYAESKDGEHWEYIGEAVPWEIGVAQAFSRPCVINYKGQYHMWYSYRSGTGQKYRIGYAVSDHGRTWERRHHVVGIDISSSGWDSEMICYPTVFEWREKLFMLYCGNGYGKEGIGLAILEL